MSLREVARIQLPKHPPSGGFDHAAIDTATDRLFVAHTANDGVDVVDLDGRTYLRSLARLKGVAGVWVDESQRLLFTSNRGEDTASVFRIETRGEHETLRVPTGVRPNGMAFDPERQLWLIAGVGDAKRSDAPPTLTFVGLRERKVLSSIKVPGRTRWATFHRPSDAFYVNIADPASILRVSADDVTRLGRTYPVPAKGPHGMEQDPGGEVLYCACDDAVLLTLNVASGEIRKVGPLAGSPDVLWLDSARERLYAATDDAATVQVFGTAPPRLLETYPTSRGAHTLTVDPKRHEVHVFLPETHEDLVLAESDDR